MASTVNSETYHDTLSMSERITHWVAKWKIFLCLAPALGIVVFFIAVILYMIVAQSIGFYNYLGESSFSLVHWKEVLSNSTTWDFFWYSFRQGILSALGAVIVAYPFALWLRNPFVGSTMMVNLLRVPMLIPSLVAAFLFVNIISYHGFINEFLVRINVWKEPRRMQNDALGIGVLILQIWKNMPFALLLLHSTLKNISLEIFDAARDMGANKRTLIWRIFLPLSLQSMRAAMVIVFIGALGDFSFNVVAGPRNLFSLSQYIVSMIQQFYEVNQAAAITILLLLASVLGVVLLAVLTKVLEVLTRGRPL